MTVRVQRRVSGAAAASRRLGVLSLWLAWLLMGTVTGLATAMASAAAAPPDERERLAGERRAVDARHAEVVAACQLRFLVSDCVALARSQQRLALDGLRRQQLLLDDARRRERAAERLKLQQDRAQAQVPAPVPAPQASAPLLRQPRQAAAGASAASAAAVAAVASAASSTALKRRQAASPTAAPASAPRAASGERQHQQAFDQRQQAAREHQHAVELRNVRRDAARQPAGNLPLPTANLPLPAASSAAAASR